MATPTTDFQTMKAFFHAFSKANTEATQNLFESQYKSAHTVLNADIWAQAVGFANTSTDADSFATANPTIVKKYVKTSLTPIDGSNGQGWYLNASGTFIRSWVSPVDVPNSVSGAPSLGYTVTLYDGNGNVIPPTSGVWVVDYYAGIILFEKDTTPSLMGWGTPQITCYVYVGTKGGTGGGGTTAGPVDLSYAILSSNAAAVGANATVNVDEMDLTQFTGGEWIINARDTASNATYFSKVSMTDITTDVLWNENTILGTNIVSTNVTRSSNMAVLSVTASSDPVEVVVSRTALKRI